MLQFSFRRRGDDALVKLAQIDDELCELVGSKSEPDSFHPLFDALQNFGTCLANRNPWYGDAEFDDMVTFQHPHRPMLRTLLVERYRFTCWRSYA